MKHNNSANTIKAPSEKLEKNSNNKKLKAVAGAAALTLILVFGANQVSCAKGESAAGESSDNAPLEQVVDLGNMTGAELDESIVASYEDGPVGEIIEKVVEFGDSPEQVARQAAIDEFNITNNGEVNRKALAYSGEKMTEEIGNVFQAGDSIDIWGVDIDNDGENDYALYKYHSTDK